MKINYASTLLPTSNNEALDTSGFLQDISLSDYSFLLDRRKAGKAILTIPRECCAVW